MKRLALLTISLILALGATFAFASPAYAESETQYNPEEFVKTLTFSALTDYAADGQTYAFAEGTKLYVYSDGGLETYTHNAQILSLDAQDGVFYFADALNGVYSLPDKAAANHDFKSVGDGILSGSYLYYMEDGELQLADKANKQFITLEGFSNPKEYDGTVYAVKDNSLYVLDGATAEKTDDMHYTDFSSTKTICVGNTANALKENYSLKFVKVNSGAFITEVDLSSLDGEYLTTGETVTVSEDFTALLLCYTGNAAIIAYGDKSYVAKLTPDDETDVDCYYEPAFEDATVTGSEIYASPYVIKGTSVLYPAAGMQVKILHKVELDGVLGASFYEVEYAVDEQTCTGYVTEGLVTEYLFGENKEPASVPDPAYSTKSNVKTVVLILVVIMLVLVAAAYLTYAGTSAKRKGRKKKNSAAGEEE